MTPATIPRWHGRPIRVREIPPDDRWLESKSPAGVYRMTSPLVEAELRLPATERAQVLYFDLPRFSISGNAVGPIILWATNYRNSVPPEEVPASLVAIGKGVSSGNCRGLRDTEVHFLNESHRSVQRLMGAEPRSHQIVRLIQNLCGIPIPATVDPYSATAATLANPGGLPAPPSPTPGWDTYTQRPPHIDPAEVETLFNWLSRKPEEWERDY